MQLLHRVKTHESQTTRILKALKKAGDYGQTNVELSKICLSWHRRIGNLRADGYGISCIRLTKGLYKYYFVSEPEK